ncbi:MAG: glutamine--fructose-6-phosphate transaminase (isomerizing) [bacterium]|nr:glutamine--fructose-6-phosphate transaminase (isomerizing) [bacterium]
MCGIFGYVGDRKNAPNLVFEGLRKLEYRGYDSWGIAAKDKDVIKVDKHVGKIGDASVQLPESTLAFGHTRWATHGGVTQINAHPHLDCTRTIALIHNGIIENYESIKKSLAKKGHNFVSQTDTEVAVHLIEEYAKKFPFREAVRRAFLKLEGLNAIIALSSNEDKLIAAKSGSPLIAGFGKGENFLASDAPAILSHTKMVHFIEDNELVEVSKDKIRIFDAKTDRETKPKIQRLTWTAKIAEKGRYPYFMLKEIYEQPKIVSDIATRTEEAKKIARTIERSYGTYMVGCGTAAYACVAASYLFSKITRRHVNWAIGSEFGYQQDFLTPKSLVMALSQSGETIDTLEAVRKAKEKGAKILAVVNVLGSTLYREADYKLLIGAGPEIGVASTKAFIGMLAHLTLLAYALTGKTEDGVKTLTMAVKSTKSVLADTNVKRLMNLAKKLKAKNHIYVVGRGLSYPASLETALKIKEISYIHAEGLAAGELKHGVIALVERGTPCIVFAPNDETYGANLAGAMEMKTRGGFIIGISHKPHEVFDYYIPVSDAAEATIIPNVVVGQVLAYYLARERGLDPDKPRNLAKSVTVR